MFALRKISSNGGEINFDLGDYYSLITKEHSPEEFEDKMKDHPNYDEAYALFTEKMEYYHYIEDNKTILFLKMGQLIVT